VLPNLPELIATFTYVFVFGVVFVETGLLVGFFLPGDSLLFTAGFLASTPQLSDRMNIWLLAAGAAFFAVVGDNVAYFIGNRIGRRLFKSDDSFFFRRKHLASAEAFYARHGGKAVILARFMPIVRTFSAVVAGIGSMPYPRFLVYDIIGGILWGAGMSIAGYYFGRLLPADKVDKYLLPVILLIIVVSLLPSVIHVWRESGDEIRVWVRRRMAGSRA
jgi:membrane-associated protein